MPTSASELVIKINGDVKNFKDRLSEAQKETEHFDDALKKVAEVSAVAFAALTASIGYSVAQFAEHEKAVNKLTLAMQNQGIYSKSLAEDYSKQAEALSTLTGIDDDAITKGQSLLQSMIGQTHITQQMTQAALDLSEQLGGDTTAGFEVLGRAIDGNTRGLRQFGIEIDEHLTKEERTAQVLQKVAVAFGGSAEAANQGLGGLRGLKTAIDDVFKALGEKFAPIVEYVIKKLTDFFQALKENDKLMAFAAGIAGAGVAITGLVTALTTTGLAIKGFTTLIGAMGITMDVALGPIGLIIGAIAAAGAAIGYFAVKGRGAKDELSELEKQIQSTGEMIKRLEPIANRPIKGTVEKQAMEDLVTLKEQYEGLMETRRKLNSQANTPKDIQDAGKKKAGDKNAQEAAAKQAREQEALKAHNRAMIGELDRYASEEETLLKNEAQVADAIADDKNKNIREKLRDHLSEMRSLEDDYHKDSEDARNYFQENIVNSEQESQALDLDNMRAFLDQHQQELENSIMNEDQARRQAALTAAQENIKAHNTQLLEQQKYGTAYALINKAMHSSVYEGSKQAFGDLAQLQQSSNSTLKAIGKAAAIANIIIKTAESAMNIYAGFATIPIVGPALGIAGAAAAVAFGAEQVGQVTAAAQGGLITGGIPGIDSVPVLAQRGELVSPAKNFEEVVGSVAAQRLAEDRGGGGVVGIAISMDGAEAERVITARQTEAKRLGLYEGAS